MSLYLLVYSCNLIYSAWAGPDADPVEVGGERVYVKMGAAGEILKMGGF